jgi:hypothetical protein
MRLGNLDDQVGRADVPEVVAVKCFRRRHVGHVPLLRALIDPSRDRRDFLLRQRWIVLELLDPDIALDVPGRHEPRSRLRLDRSRVRPRVLVRNERHRRIRSGTVAVLAGPLENRRHVFCECDGRRRRGSRGRRRALRRSRLRPGSVRRRRHERHHRKNRRCSHPRLHFLLFTFQFLLSTFYFPPAPSPPSPPRTIDNRSCWR